MQFKEISGSIVAPQGFLASGVFCDIKRLGTGKGSNKGQKRDLALIVSEVPATVAGMFTTNQVCAAPVKVCVERVKKGVAQAIVVNSGNANACTGKQGLADAREMAAFAERSICTCRRSTCLVGSTGRIGVTMPMDNVRAGIIEAVTLLGSFAGQRRPRRRSHHDQRHAAQANRGRIQAGRQNRPHRRHLQRRGHDSAGHERHRRAAGRRCTACTRRCFASSPPTRRLRQKSCRPRCRKPSRKVSTASPWTAT